MTRRLAAAAIALLLLAPAARAGADLRQAWNDLTSEDDAKAARAVLALARSPKEGVAFLKNALRPGRRGAGGDGDARGPATAGGAGAGRGGRAAHDRGPRGAGPAEGEVIRRGEDRPPG